MCARVYMPAVSIRAAGKVNDIVFSNMDADWNGSIQTARIYQSVVFNPNTVDQQLVRATFAAAVSFWKLATDKTIGAAIFSREDFGDEYRVLQLLKQYKGIPVTGDNAGRQLFIGAAVVVRITSAFPDPLLPQDCTLEAQLDDILAWTADVFVAADARVQRWRLGYQE